MRTNGRLSLLASTNRSWLKIVPDTTWSLEEVRERFEVPIEMIPGPLDLPHQTLHKLARIEGIGRVVASKAIERYEKLRHWRFRDDIPVVLDVSELQTDLDLTSSPTLKTDDLVAFDQGILTSRKATKAYVMVLTFETQQIIKAVIDDEVGRPEGIINPDEPIYPDDIEHDL